MNNPFVNWTLAALLITQSAFAISEQSFEKDYQSKVIPYSKSAVSGTLGGKAGVPLFYQIYEVEHEKGAILLIPGRSEPAIKFAEVAYDFGILGYTVYVIDLRGQGNSGRMLSDSQIGYVDHFQDYVDDVANFVDTVVTAKPHSNLFLVAHSLGGAIAGLYLNQNPGKFKAAAFSAPMFQINTGKYSELEAIAITSVMTFVGKGGIYARGKGPHNPNEKFEDNDVTRSRARFEKYAETLNQHPDAIIAGPSNRWVQQALIAMHEFREQPKGIATPFLLMEAGADQIVLPAAEELVCKNSPHCTTVKFDDSFHEIFMERDTIRDRAFKEMDAFFSNSLR